jgi:hypothetical protein
MAGSNKSKKLGSAFGTPQLIGNLLGGARIREADHRFDRVAHPNIFCRKIGTKIGKVSADKSDGFSHGSEG